MPSAGETSAGDPAGLFLNPLPLWARWAWAAAAFSAATLVLYGLTLADLGSRSPAPDTDLGRGLAVALVVVSVALAALVAGRYVRRARGRGAWACLVAALGWA